MLREKQFIFVSIKKYLYVDKDLSDLIHKPDEAKWPETAALRNPDVTKISITCSYALDST
jgi:hypothetical protein